MNINLDFLQSRPLSYSSIKEFAKSPRHYVEYLMKPKFQSTDAMKLGSMVHTLLLQNELFDSKFFVAPDINKRTNEGKKEWLQLLEDNSNKDIVSKDDYELALKLTTYAMGNKQISGAIKNCNDFEQEWHQDIDGLPYRGFYDGVADDYILEVKTTKDASPKTVMSDFYRNKYHIQSSLYNLTSEKPILYLVIETTYPYLSYIAFTDDSFINQGNKDLKFLNNKFNQCIELEDFTSGYEFFYDNNIKISLPWNVDK